MHELAEKGQESLELSMNPKAVENSIATLIHWNSKRIQLQRYILQPIEKKI
jgi:hypothetical protein